MIFFGKYFVNNKKWKQDLSRWSLYYRTEIVLTTAGLIVGFLLGVII